MKVIVFVKRIRMRLAQAFFVNMLLLSVVNAEPLLVFGGAGYRTFLGCLNCSKYDPNSIANTFGSYGSKYSPVSVRNRYGAYGSQYSSYSACSPYASRPPLVMGQSKKFYGALSVNRYHRYASRTLFVFAQRLCAG